MTSKKRGFHYRTEAYVLPGSYITPMQRTVLNRMAAYYSHISRGEFGGSPFFGEMAALFARLGGDPPPAVSKPLWKPPYLTALS